MKQNDLIQSVKKIEPPKNARTRTQAKLDTACPQKPQYRLTAAAFACLLLSLLLVTTAAAVGIPYLLKSRYGDSILGFAEYVAHGESAETGYIKFTVEEAMADHHTARFVFSLEGKTDEATAILKRLFGRDWIHGDERIDTRGAQQIFTGQSDYTVKRFSTLHVHDDLSFEAEYMKNMLIWETVHVEDDTFTAGDSDFFYFYNPIAGIFVGTKNDIRSQRNIMSGAIVTILDDYETGNKVYFECVIYNVDCYENPLALQYNDGLSQLSLEIPTPKQVPSIKADAESHAQGDSRITNLEINAFGLYIDWIADPVNNEADRMNIADMAETYLIYKDGSTLRMWTPTDGIMPTQSFMLASYRIADEQSGFPRHEQSGYLFTKLQDIDQIDSVQINGINYKLS